MRIIIGLYTLLLALLSSNVLIRVLGFVFGMGLF
jgi:hypothetical protein